MTPRESLAGLWTAAGLPAPALEAASLTGADPVLPSSFAVGQAAQASIAASALAAAEIGHLRGLPRQGVAVDMRHAAIEFHSEHWMLVDGKPPPDHWDRIAGTYRCGDGGYVRLHTNFPHHRDGVLKLLGCAYDKAAVAAALAQWSSFDFEDAAAAAGLCVTAMRDFATWDVQPQARAVQSEPLVAITRIGDAPPEPLPALPPDGRPLAGLRVLDLTRVIAGPVCGRTLAAHGADVLHVTSPNLPNFPLLVIDTGRGKLCTQLDLADPAGSATLRGLLGQADIFVQGYRPGALAALGLAPTDTARLRPGIVHVSLCAHGHTGPWAGRRGFDSLVQTATGFNAAEAEAAGISGPKPLPVQALDHASGYLLAFGALAALHRRATEGGSWHVQVSLSRTGHWIRGLGRVADGLACPAPAAADVAPLLAEMPSGFGTLSAVRHAAQLERTPARWDRPSMPLDSHPAEWPAR